MRLSVLVCALALAATQAQAATARWIGSWAASPAPPMTVAPGFPPSMLTPGFNNQTVVQLVRLSAGGQKLRIRFTNEYGPKPLAIGAARVVLVGLDGAAIPGSDRPLTFAGGKTATIPPARRCSAIRSPCRQARSRGCASASTCPARTGACTCHMSGSELVQVSPPGDYTERDLPPATGPAQYRAFLSGVEVETDRPGKVIVAFGDSITDGYLSTNGANRRWPDRLAERLAQRYPGRAMAVVNAGIGGNRVLSDGVVGIFGQSAPDPLRPRRPGHPGRHPSGRAGRRQRPGFEQEQPAQRPEPDRRIQPAHRPRARPRPEGHRRHGAALRRRRLFGAKGETERQALNAWIRTGGGFDAVIDFDAAIRDPAQPDRMRADLHAGDWLHPNDAGYRAMGEARRPGAVPLGRRSRVGGFELGHVELDHLHHGVEGALAAGGVGAAGGRVAGLGHDCHETPNLSFSQPHWTGWPPSAVSFSQ